MKHIKNRLLSVLLVLVTVLTLLPTTAFAATSTGTGIKATTNSNYWTTRLLTDGTPYSYRPPMAAGKMLYCCDRGYGYRWGTESFLNSYTYTSATGADADEVLKNALALSGLGELDAQQLENVKWMMTYIVDYKGEIPGSLFMALQTYIWDNQTYKGGGDGDIDAGGYANADTYETYLGYIDWMLGQKANEDAAYAKQIEEYAAQGKVATVVEDDSAKWAVYARSSVQGRQSFFNYYAPRKLVVTPAEAGTPEEPPAGDADITLIKVEAGTTRGLAGARFLIYRDGQIVGSDVTNSRGIIEVNDVTKGLWSFVETDAPEGFCCDHTPVSVYVDTTDGDKQYTVTAENHALPSLKITKSDAQTYAKVKATFLVESLTGSYSTTVTVDGEKVLQDLQPGVYRITEQSVEEPYIKTGTHQDIALLAGAGTVEASFTNYQKPGLEILKKNIANGDPIAHVTYKIEQIDGSYSTTATTDSKGRIFLDSVPVGSYKITEINVPSDVILCDIPQEIALGPGETRTVTFFNAVKPSLKIIKRCEITKDPIPNTKFHIWWASDNTTTGELNDLGTYYTDENGEIILTGDALDRGWYKVTEEVPAAGFAPADEPTQEFYLAGNENAVKIWENRPLSALVIFKYDEKTGAALQGAEFTVRYLGGTSGTGGTVIGTYTTSENGTIVITGCKAGTYVVEETKSSPFYSIDTAPQTALLTGKEQDVVTLRCGNLPYGSVLIKKLADDANKTPLEGATFLVTDDKGAFIGTSNGEFTTGKNGAIQLPKLPAGTTVVAKEIRAPEGYALDSTPQTITVQAGEASQLVFYNKPLCNLTILKRDAVTKKLLSNAEFIVKDSTGTPIGPNNGRYITGSDGTVTVTGLQPNSTVIVSEDKAPTGYIKDEMPQTIVVKSGVPNSLTFDNEPSSTLIIHKYIEGTDNEPLAGACFKVTDGSGAAVGPDDGVYYTDQTGEIVLTGLEPGTTVIAREVKTVDGFVLDGTPQDILIKAGEVQNLTFWNKRQGALIINKLSSQDRKTPLEGVTFKITTATGEFVPDEDGKISSNGLYYTDENGQIILKGVTGTLVVTEVSSIPGYTIDESTRTQTVVVNPEDTQSLYFYNQPVGGAEIIKVNEADRSERIPNTTFEIRRVDDDALVDTVTTDSNGRVFVTLEDGSYYAVEVVANKEFRLDSTPHYFTVKDGICPPITVTNRKLSGIIIHKIDSRTEEGIYGVKFVLYDSNRKPIGEYTTDDEGYIYIDDIPDGLSGRFYLRELEAADGYILDKEYKTVNVKPGKTVEIEWENTAVTGQIQIYKYAAEYNTVTGTAPGTPLQGAVYEIINARSGKVVDYITTDARGVAASKPLPLTRYQIREVTAPAYWQVDSTVHDVTLEYAGQIIKLSAYDKAAALGVSITKRGNAEVLAGSQMRYNITVANTSNVPLENFFWHDRIPTDVARATVLTTGTYSARLNYRILFRTNYSANYQVLASNLLTSNNYSFALNAIPMQVGEVVTDIYFDFGTVPVGFQSVTGPTLSVMVNGTAVNGYQMVNRADVGGKYQGTWQTAQANWVTIIRKLGNTPTLPKTGY